MQNVIETHLKQPPPHSSSNVNQSVDGLKVSNNSPQHVIPAPPILASISSSTSNLFKDKVCTMYVYRCL
jgi:hypothetical protein